MSQYLLEIENMRCAYQADAMVLKVPLLKVERGKVLFLVGPSGIGKSTLIEALGLMNNTILNDDQSKVAFYATPEAPSIDLRQLWHTANEQISHFRNQYFSFIFQNTNLMQNFTAGENMCISQLIANVPLAEAKEKVLHTMDALNLSPDLFDRKVTELSGGQRQRLAFVRAITAHFTVLFGDEPTGNLDKNTGFQLMHILKSNLRGEHRSAIIVSHDLELALEFADQIIIMTPRLDEKGRIFGEILIDNTLVKSEDNWCSADGVKIVDPDQYLKQSLGLTPNKA